MTDDNLPEVEAPLPDNLLDRLEELHRRKEERGLTEVEKAIVLNDLRQFNKAMTPLMETMGEAMGELAEAINNSVEILARAMTEVDEDE